MPLERVQSEAEAWLRSSSRRGHSENTIAEKRRILGKFFWFVEREGYQSISHEEIDAYLEHVQKGHLEPEGRFGVGPKQSKAFQPVRPHTYRYHWDTLAAWFAWQTEKSGCWNRNPFDFLEAANVPEDTTVKPFSEAEIEAMLIATRKSYVPTRDYAILRLMLDTGVRAAELCGMLVGDVDEKNSSIQIMAGKGNKRRIVHFGQKAGRALFNHLAGTGLSLRGNGRRPAIAALLLRTWPPRRRVLDHARAVQHH